jgi:hypothetical protein
VPYPRFDQSWVSLLCAMGPRPLVMTGWLRLWLAGHFQKANLEDSEQSTPTDQTIQKMLWKPDNTTGIVIESHTRYLPEMTEKHPAVIIKRNGWKRIRLGIGDRMMGPADPTGQDVYGNLWQGSHTLFCIAGKGAETEKLAAEVYRELNEFAPIFRATLDLMRFEVTEVGELMMLDQARSNFLVPITVAYGFMESWRVNREVPLLCRLDMAIMQP